MKPLGQEELIESEVMTAGHSTDNISTVKTRSVFLLLGSLFIVASVVIYLQLGFRKSSDQAIANSVSGLGGVIRCDPQRNRVLRYLLGAVSDEQYILGDIISYVQLGRPGGVASSAPTAVTDSDLAVFRRKNAVEWIGLNQTNVGDEGIEHLSGCTHLQILELNYTLVTSRSLESIAKLGTLQTLYLDGTSVSDEGLVYLPRLHRLSKLSLAGTAVSDYGVESLLLLRNLKSLDVSNTRISPESVGLLKKALPNCDINAWFE